MNINDIGIDIENDLNDSHLSVHLRIQKRSGRRCITHIEGLGELPTMKDESLDAFVKELRKKFNCSGSIKKGTISLSGDHRQDIKELLVKKGWCKEEQIKIHGF